MIKMVIRMKKAINKTCKQKQGAAAMLVTHSNVPALPQLKKLKAVLRQK